MFILFANLEIFYQFTNKQNNFFLPCDTEIFFINYFIFLSFFKSSNEIYLGNNSNPEENI